jgi:hypothetical protein
MDRMNVSVDVDVGAIVDARVAARIERVRRRRAALAAFQKAHVQRREYGNRARHAAKLARQADG